MRIGITFDLKNDGHANGQCSPVGVPDDFQEEFDSPVTIDAIRRVLTDLGHHVVLLGDGRDLLEKLLADPPDFVFNIAEGQGIGRSREARVPAVLEMLGIPYTGSDPLTLAATLDKDCAKRLVASAGVAVPRGMVVAPEQCFEITDSWQYPLIVKPAWEGSSKGIRAKCLARTREELRDVIDTLRRDYQQPVLVEEFIQGEELTVGMVGNDPPEIIGVLRVHPNQPTEHFVYSLEVKRDFRRQVRYECPARLSEAVDRAVHDGAQEVYRVLGCRDVSRVDFRLKDGVPYFLEVNPLPGVNPESSDLVILAELAGWTYPRLIETILRAALNRQPVVGAPAPATA